MADDAPAPSGPRLRPRLAFWIYLTGLLQFVAVAVGFPTLLWLTRPPGGGPFEGQFRYAIGTIEASAADPAALREELSRARMHLHLRARVLGADGRVVASTMPPGEPPCQPPQRPPPGPAWFHRDPVCVRLPLSFPDGSVGALDLLPHHRPPLLGWHVVLIVVVVVGVSSWLLARSLTGPLGRLSAAARALGGGDLSARTGLRRDDELGEVARAFDEMADRVAELLRAEKELLAGVSHELRTPLARIRVALDIAAEGDPATAQELLVDIKSDLDELERLISDVLTAARLDLDKGSGGAPPLRRQSIAVDELLEQSAARFRSAHPERPLLADLAPGLPSIEGDPVLLRRVIDNLLENAHRYTEQPDHPVQLVARSRGGSLEIEVIDQGMGIAPDDLPRVFRPFFRADRSRARATGGLGLGLALSRRIVEAHGGRIELLSQVNQGTVARVELPLAAGLLLAGRRGPGSWQLGAPCGGLRLARRGDEGQRCPSPPRRWRGLHEGMGVRARGNAFRRTPGGRGVAGPCAGGPPEDPPTPPVSPARVSRERPVGISVRPRDSSSRPVARPPLRAGPCSLLLPARTTSKEEKEKERRSCAARRQREEPRTKESHGAFRRVCRPSCSRCGSSICGGISEKKTREKENGGGDGGA